jgi:hypothetical membrane protein
MKNITATNAEQNRYPYIFNTRIIIVGLAIIRRRAFYLNRDVSELHSVSIFR